MFKKITTLFLAAVIFTTASSISVFAKNISNDEPQKKVQTENRRETFLKKENKANFDEKENLNSYNKQKQKRNKFSTSTKILIGVGIVAVIGVVIFAANSKVEPFKNGVL